MKSEADLDKLLRQLRCLHGYFLHKPCPKYERSSEEAKVYRPQAVARIIEFGVPDAENFLAAFDLFEASENR